MSTPSRSAIARSAGSDRVLMSLLGIVALALGVGAVLLGTGVFGAGRGARPLLDPIAVQTVTDQRMPVLIGAAVVGVLLLVVGLWLALRSVRPERKPDMVLDPSPSTGLTVTAAALADALRADAESVPGVGRAKARMVGTTDRPALRLSLWLEQGADLRAVWDDLDTGVLGRAREALGVEKLPTAVRIELDAASGSRVG